MALPAAAWGLSRHALDAGLAAAAVRCGAEFWPATVVTGVTRGEDGSSVQGAPPGSPSPSPPCLPIFACGRHSAAALPPRSGAADGKTDGKTDARRGWRHCAGLKRHYTGVRMEPRERTRSPGGYVGINPIPGQRRRGRANVCALVTYAAFQALGRSLDCVLAAACARHPALACRLQDAQPAPKATVL